MSADLRERCARAGHVVTPDGAVLSAGRASLYVLGTIGWRRSAALLSAPPLVWLVELGYRFVARHRGTLGRWLFRR